jgi:hypothetical protein
MNETPERYLHSNQTPHRSANLLTPPSSEERPPAQSLPAEDSATSRVTEPSAKVSLAEKIMAQSALYSQAIQKQQQQQQHSTNSSLVPPLNTNTKPSGVTLPHFRSSTNKAQSPTFTFHRLQQQQQQFFTRHSVTDEHENPHTGENVNTAPSDMSIALTAVELPVIAEEVIHADGEKKVKAKDVDRSKPALPIPKPDPLDNPLK